MGGNRAYMAALGACAVLAVPGAARAITLGGSHVPRERFVVYLLIGHSNMAGRDGRRADTATHPRCWNFRWYADEQWVPAVETHSNRRGLTPRGSGGPGMAFLKLMAAKYRSYHFGVILNASSAASASGGSNCYRKGKGRLYDEIVGAAQKVREEVTFGGVLCMLGVNEHRDAERAARFASDIKQIVGDLRGDLGQPELPFLIGQYEAGSRGSYDPRGANARAVIKQIFQIPKLLTHAAIVDSRGIEMADDHHYTFPGHIEWSRRAVAVIAKKRWLPPPGARKPAPPPKPVPVARTPPKPYVPPPRPDEWPVTANGLIFLWHNAKARNIVTDPARGKPRPCTVLSTGRAVLGPHHEMDAAGGAFIAQDADDEVLYDACRNTDQLALEALVTSDQADQKDAYIISFLPERGCENFALVQDGENLLLKIKVGFRAKRALAAELCELEPGEPKHVLVSCVGGLLTCYVNGRLAATRRDIRGGFRGWLRARLCFGDGWGHGHDWRGRIEGVAIYNRHISSTHARWKSNLYRAGLHKRPPIPRLRLHAKLTAKSTPTVHTGVYGDALILYRYKVLDVLQGNCPHEEIQVLHWGGLDDKPIRSVLQRKVGQRHTLVVEPADRHPQLATVRLGADAEDFDLPRWYDVARPLRD